MSCATRCVSGSERWGRRAEATASYVSGGMWVWSRMFCVEAGSLGFAGCRQHWCIFHSKHAVNRGGSICSPALCDETALCSIPWAWAVGALRLLSAPAAAPGRPCDTEFKVDNPCAQKPAPSCPARAFPSSCSVMLARKQPPQEPLGALQTSKCEQALSCKFIQSSSQSDGIRLLPLVMRRAWHRQRGGLGCADATGDGPRPADAALT